MLVFEIFCTIYAIAMSFKISGMRWYGKWLKLVRILVKVRYVVMKIFNTD